MNPSIHITSVVQTEKGAVMSCYCPECKTTQFFFSEHAVKPSKGDLWFVNEMCIDNPAHNMRIKAIRLTRDNSLDFPRWVDRTR